MSLSIPENISAGEIWIEEQKWSTMGGEGEDISVQDALSESPCVDEVDSSLPRRKTIETLYK